MFSKYWTNQKLVWYGANCHVQGEWVLIIALTHFSWIFNFDQKFNLGFNFGLAKTEKRNLKNPKFRLLLWERKFHASNFGFGSGCHKPFHLLFTEYSLNQSDIRGKKDYKSTCLCYWFLLQLLILRFLVTHFLLIHILDSFTFLDLFLVLDNLVLFVKNIFYL